ncbi:MAG: M48 family metalloprotease [Verrucomicrobiales bacterium]|nr:M48 family metalloprotease [Verrucomicrobiales bacterium]
MNKKRLEEIRRDASFGEHTRDSLVALADNVFERLGLRRRAAPVFLTRAKDINAQAVRCELWPGLHLFNGVFLNRSVIHLLDRQELASIVGHELGHVFPYAPILSRCYLVHSVFAGAISFALTVSFPVAGVAFLGPLALLWLLDRVIAFPHLRLSRGIEFLCDDYGAQAAGLLPALSAELKIIAEQEVRQSLMLRLLEARTGGSACSLSDLVEAYEDAVPFGKADPDSFQRDFQKLAAQKHREAKQISLRGFLRHLQGSDGAGEEEWAKEQTERIRLLNQVPLLALDRAPYLQGSALWSLDSAEALAVALEQGPDRVLARLPDEIDDRTLSHPCASRRLLFLWRNRECYPLRQ